MNKKLILTSVVIFFASMVFAQAPSIEWQKKLITRDGANAVQQISDGGYIVAGVSRNGNYYDYSIEKLNANGITQWQKTFGGSGDDRPSAIRQTSDGGYIVAGSSTSNNGDVSGNHGQADYWIVKLNADGTIKWQKSLGGSRSDTASDIQQTSDGGYIVAGSSYSNDGDVSGHHDNPNTSDFWIVKLNSDGVIQWQKSLGGGQHDDAHSIQQTLDGGYIIAGRSFSGGSAPFDYGIVKLSADGPIQWQKLLNVENDTAYAIRQTPDGGYIVAGSTADHRFEKNDWYIVKLDGSGTIQWQKILGGSNDDIAYDIQQTTDGGYIIAGTSRSTDGDVAVSYGSFDYWIVKLSVNGAIQWQKTLGGSAYDYPAAIQQTLDEGFIIAGFAGSNDGDITDTETDSLSWVVKLSRESLNTNEAALNNTVFIENPVKDLLKIYSKETIKSLQLYNAGGQLIKTSNSQNMSVKELSKGNYILKIKLENGTVISEKIIKE